MDTKQDITIKSWDQTWTYHPKVLATPTSVDDIVEIMKDKSRYPSPVRPAGSMHSTARMNGDDQGGTMVDMKAMNHILYFNEDSVTVEAGVSHQQLANALKERGLQPYITTEIGNVTLAAMATAATKDSSFPGGFGQISSYVTSVKLVTPQGQVREITAKDNPDEMRLIRSSYGLFGIVYEVTIKVQADDRALGPSRLALLEGVPRQLPALQGGRLRGDVLHLPLCAPHRRRAQEGQSEREAHIAASLVLPQSLLAKIRTGAQSLDPASRRPTRNIARPPRT